MTDLLIVNGPLGQSGSSIVAISVGHPAPRVAPPSLRLPSIPIARNAVPEGLRAILSARDAEQASNEGEQ